MSSVNIPSSLKTISQKPLDAKTQRDTLNDLITFNDSDAYSFWAGMEVRVSQNNKKYIWKEVTSEQPISPTFTYPSGHVVDSYNYSNKTFGFYEIVNSNESKVYKTSVFNVPPDPLWWNYNSLDNQAGMIYKSIENVVDESTNQVTQRIGLASILSNTLTIRNSVHIGEDGNVNTNALHIDYYGDGSSTPVRGELPDRVVPDEWTIVLPDSDGFINLRRPVEGPARLRFPDGGRLNASTIDTILANGVDNNFEIVVGEGKVLELEKPLFKGNVTTGNIKLKGGQFLYTPSDSEPLISVNKTLGTYKISATDTAFKTNGNINSKLISSSNVDELTINNVEIDSNTLSNIETRDTSAKLNNVKVVFNGSSNTFMDVIDSSDVKIENTEFEGGTDRLITINSTDVSVSPKVLVNNSDLTKLTITDEIFSTVTPDEIANNFIKLNNTEINVGTTVSSSVSNIRQSNVISDTPPPIIEDIEISDVNGLTQALSDKAETVHTHTISDVNGLDTVLDETLNNKLSNVSSTISNSEVRNFKDVIKADTLLIESSSLNYSLVLNHYSNVFLLHSGGDEENYEIIINIPNGDFNGQTIELDFTNREYDGRSTVNGSFLILPNTAADYTETSFIEYLAIDKRAKFIWSSTRNRWITIITDIKNS